MNPQTEISILKKEKQIAELEANLLRKQAGFETHGRAKYSMPKIARTTMLFGFLILAFITLLALVSTPFVSLSWVIMGIVLTLGYAFSIYQSYKKAEYYEEEKVKYEEQREILLLEIQKLKSDV